jgi:hypothetical protein
MTEHLIETTSAQAFTHAEVPKHSETEWAEIISSDLGRAVEGIIAAGQHLQQAKYQLGHGRFLPLLRSIKSAGGSLFDLALDRAEDIGRQLADHMSEGKFDAAGKAARARYKAKRQRPAG